MTPQQLRLQTAIDVATRAARRLERSAVIDRALLDQAIGEESEYEALTRVVDAFIQRFQQFIKHMTRRLYPAIYRIAESDRAPPLVTLLAYLEGIGLIESERDWLATVELRNRLVHEYPLDDRERAAALTRIADLAPALIGDLMRARAFISDNRLLGTVE